jgi:hypothetical protein
MTAPLFDAPSLPPGTAGGGAGLAEREAVSPAPLQFVVHGKPAPQGSKKGFIAGGRAIVVSRPPVRGHRLHIRRLRDWHARCQCGWARSSSVWAHLNTAVRDHKNQARNGVPV